MNGIVKVSVCLWTSFNCQELILFLLFGGQTFVIR